MEERENIKKMERSLPKHLIVYVIEQDSNGEVSLVNKTSLYTDADLEEMVNQLYGCYREFYNKQ
jgi:hypothetical protein